MKQFELEYDNKTRKGVIKLSKCKELKFYKDGSIYKVPILDLIFINLDKLKTYFSNLK